MKNPSPAPLLIFSVYFYPEDPPPPLTPNTRLCKHELFLSNYLTIKNVDHPLLFHVRSKPFNEETAKKHPFHYAQAPGPSGARSSQGPGNEQGSEIKSPPRKQSAMGKNLRVRLSGCWTHLLKDDLVLFIFRCPSNDPSCDLRSHRHTL